VRGERDTTETHLHQQINQLSAKLIKTRELLLDAITGR
jgi:hypothetical protein